VVAAVPGPKVLRRVPDGWPPFVPSLFSIEPMGPTLGARVTGVDVRRPMTEQLLGELWRALLEWKLLVFDDQPLTPAEHVGFASRFGPLFDDSTGAARKPDPLDNYVRFVRESGAYGLDNVWHTDGSFRPEPPVALSLQALEIPPVGGDTVFADMAVAYDNLSDALKLRMADLEAENDWSVGFYSRSGFYGDRQAEYAAQLPPVRHRVARPHPVTGRITLYVNRAFTARLVDDDAELFEALRSQVEVPEYQVRLRWRPNTFVLFDNQALQHYATNDYAPHRRAMGRATIGAWSPELLGLARPH
jgi:taurine dioxygenase